MLDLWKSQTLGQFEAALKTLHMCIEECPDASWDAPVADMKYCQVAFHTLFFADCYLSVDTDAMLAQPYHSSHKAFFRDYEEMEPRAQVLLYERADVLDYLQFCLQKCRETIAAETEASLKATAGFSWLKCCRAEVYQYNIRHIQHHAAAMSLRLRLDHGIGIGWVKRGWE